MTVQIKKFEENGVTEFLVFGPTRIERILKSMDLIKNCTDRLSLIIFYENIGCTVTPQRMREIRKTRPYEVIIHIDNILDTRKS